MQLEQVGTCKYINSRSGRTKDDKAYYTLNVSDNENQIFQFYCNYDVYQKIRDLEFGDEMQLVFGVQQWRNGLNINVTDLIVKKK